MSELASERCVPCKGGVPPLEPAKAEELLTQLDPAWSIVDGHHLERRFAFDDFAGGLAFVNAVGALAEDEGHHPDLSLRWGEVRVTLWTHAIDGLAYSDFVLAAKIDDLRA